MQIKRKIPSFVFGVSIGLLIGIAFFLFKIDSIFNSIRSVGSDKVTVVEQKVGSDEEKEKTKNKERFKIKVNNQARVNYKEVDSISNSDARINVVVDQLLSSKLIKIINLTNSNSNDTLAQNVSGVNSIQSDSYVMEFWKTPLNSKGYRFQKNKIMLYGINDHNDLLLYQFEGRYFIKSFEVVYELESTQDFQPLVKVNNVELLSKLDS
ncbi:MAG: hypothetical protein IPG08_12110 [Sphingobacteriaceae bacterium]|nr:hypothetical protein [Sphingobacteriaceae bacterium]